MNQNTYVPINKQAIIDFYVNDNNASLKTAAAKIGCTVKVLWRALKYYEIPSKSHGRLGVSKNRSKPKTLAREAALRDRNIERHAQKEKIGTYFRGGLVSKEQIIEIYSNTDLNQDEAADILGISRGSFKKNLNLYGITSKPKYRNAGKHSAFPELANREWLERELETKTISQIAHEIGGTEGNVSDRVTRYNLNPGKTTSEKIVEGIAKAKKTGVHTKRDSYRTVRAPKGHLYATRKGHIAEHRLIAEQKIGRVILPHEEVHHINQNKLDNRPENLVVLSRSEHKKMHELEKEYNRKKRRLENLSRVEAHIKLLAKS